MDNISGGNSTSDTFSVDLDALEGFEVGAGANDSANNGSDNNNGGQGQEDDPFAGIEVEEKYKSLDPKEGLLRTLKSRYDKTSNDFTKLASEHESALQKVELFNQVFTDEGLFYALVNEVKPELVRNVDYGSRIKEELKKEFGEGFKPTLTRHEAEKDDPGGTDWKYYRKLDELSSKFSQGGSHSLKVKEYLEEKTKAEKAERAKMEADFAQMKKELKLGDDEAKAVMEWGNKLTPRDLVKIHRFLRKLPSSPGITRIPGESGTKSSADNYLDEIFGKKKQ